MPAGGVKPRKGGVAPAEGKKKGKVEDKADVDDDLEALRTKLAEARKAIALSTQPITALRLFVLWLVGFLIMAVRKVLFSYITWFVALPLVAAYVGAIQNFPDLFLPPVCGEAEAGVLWWVELASKEIFWWMLLGILSSVGFGTGLHSGLMFLFPHVMQVVGAAEGCQTTVGLVPWYQHPCKLDCATTTGPKDMSTVTMLRLWALVTVPCILWGIGTAVGELPPYLVSRAARRAGSKDEDFEAELAEARASKTIFSRMKVWTIDFTEKHGFLGVFLLASWPNAAFDMCGMCCGYLNMPFWTFFIATTLGKGVVKVNLQALFFINLFGSTAFQILLTGLDSIGGALRGVLGEDLNLRLLAEKGRAKLVLKFEEQSRFPPEKLFANSGLDAELDLRGVSEFYSKHDESEAIASRVIQHWDADLDGNLSATELVAAASRTDGKISLGSLDPGAGTSVLKVCWELFVVGLVLFFLVSVIEQMARSKQAELDEAELERYKQERQKKK